MTRPERRDAPGRLAVVGSAVLHLGVLLVFWLGQGVFRSVHDYEVIEISLVSPPPAEAGEPEPEPTPPEEPVVETPEPEPEEEPPPEEEAEAPPEREEDTRKAEPEPEEEPTPPKGPDPEPETENAGEGLDVRMEGLRARYPAYYENIIRQLYRYFRWRGATDLEAEISFVIERDGSVSDIDFVRRSGNFAFDLEAMGAVESAGANRAFGPLPEGYPADRMPVSFYFSPAR